MASEMPPPRGVIPEELGMLDLARACDPALAPFKSDYYFAFYDDMFASSRGAALNILEVGVFRGGSTLLFAKYFPRARILAVDIEAPPAEFFEAVAAGGFGDRIKVAIVSQSDESGLEGAIESYFGQEPLDLVIDDASHLYPETRATFNTVFGPHLKAGGTYVIEDWGCGYWPSWGDGDPDGQHGLPRLIKELVDLVALQDRTMLREGRRTLPVESELASPISSVVLTLSLAAFVRSEAAMPSPSLVWGDEPGGADVMAPAAEVDAGNPPLALRALLRLIPAAARRAAVARRDRLSSILRRSTSRIGKDRS